MRILSWLRRLGVSARKTAWPREMPVLTDEEIREKIAATEPSRFYDRNYFDKGGAAGSGYARYGSREPGIREAARVITDQFRPQCVLEVGCAKGYVVDILQRHGINAWGIDLSRYAIEAAPSRVKNRLAVADILHIPYAENSFDLVACLETLEHLPVERAADAVAELYRLTSDKLWVSIPSMGVNDFGPPDGWPQGKIREGALSRYLRNHSFPDPAPLGDLMLDADGYPIHGHLLAASYRWWTEVFTRQGFVRRGDIERQIARAEPLVSNGVWNTYVLEKPRVASSLQDESTGARTGLPQTAELALSLDESEEVTSGQEAELSVRAPTAGSSRGLLRRVSGIHLPPGRYEALFHLGIEGPWTQSSPWSELAVLDVRSSKQNRIHGLRTVRLRDFESASERVIVLSFASGGESDFAFRVWVGGDCPGHAAGEHSVVLRRAESSQR